MRKESEITCNVFYNILSEKKSRKMEDRYTSDFRLPTSNKITLGFVPNNKNYKFFNF